MKLTLYYRTFPFKGTPLIFSFSPTPEGAVGWYENGTGERFKEEERTLEVTVPDGARVEKAEPEDLLVWNREGHQVKMPARAVNAYCEFGDFGFRK